MSRPSSSQSFLLPSNPAGTTSALPSPAVHPLYPGLIHSEEGIRMLPLPGVRCPNCQANGQEVWVIPGRACGNCGTPVY